ncbi:MAG: DUF22 domain-containing protein [Archaeoglobaceae archaeon]|nr:DUF22 domain-containing protein [Archaeoglobaceae archaeon]
MKAEVRYWSSAFGEKIEKMDVVLKSPEFRIAPFAQLKPLIAEKDVAVEKCKPTVVEVQKTKIPANTLLSCLSETCHALGTTIGIFIPGKPPTIEEEKNISQVVFIPFEDGVIKKDDIVGKLKVFFVRTDFLGKLGLTPHKLEIPSEEKIGKLSWKEDDKVARKEIKIVDAVYKNVYTGLLEPVIADENLKFHRGEIIKVKIKCISLQQNTLVAPIGFMENAYGSLIGIFQKGRPRKVEEDRKINYAIFLPIEDGRIEQGDLLGAVAIYFIKGNLEAMQREEKMFTTVYRSGSGIIKTVIKAKPYGFRRSPIARMEFLIADENRKIKEGEVCLISIKRLKLPKNTIVCSFGVLRHPYGMVINPVLKKMGRIEEEREVNKVVFLPLMDGNVKKGEIIGALTVYGVEVKALDKIKGWLKDLFEQKDVNPPIASSPG